MRRMFIAAWLASAGAAAAQTTAADIQNRLVMDAARAGQSSFGVQLQLQDLGAAQSRLQTQQALRSLEAARPAAPSPTTDYPASSGVRRPGAASTVVPPTPTAPASDTDSATRGDLPL